MIPNEQKKSEAQTQTMSDAIFTEQPQHSQTCTADFVINILIWKQKKKEAAIQIELKMPKTKKFEKEFANY